VTKSQKLSHIARILLTALVTGGIFRVSFQHITEVAEHYGNTYSIAVWYPICIDGMILISALTLVAGRGVNKSAKRYAVAGRWVGFAFTIYANMIHGGMQDVTGMIVNLIPAVSLIIVMELLIHAAQGTPATKRARNRSASK
jgi:hypothetical protein